MHTMPRYNIAQRIMYIHLAYLHNSVVAVVVVLLLFCFWLSWWIVPLFQSCDWSVRVRSREFTLFAMQWFILLFSQFFVRIVRGWVCVFVSLCLCALLLSFYVCYLVSSILCSFDGNHKMKTFRLHDIVTDILWICILVVCLFVILIFAMLMMMMMNFVVRIKWVNVNVLWPFVVLCCVWYGMVWCGFLAPLIPIHYYFKSF